MPIVEYSDYNLTELPIDQFSDRPDWVYFLFQLGRRVERYRVDGRRPSVIVVTPTVEFASLLIAGGIISCRVQAKHQPVASEAATKFGNSVGKSVTFPRIVKGVTKQFNGVLDAIEVFNGRERLKIKYQEKKNGNKLTCWSYVNSEDFQLVKVVGETFNLVSHQQGTRLASKAASVGRLIGSENVNSLFGATRKVCWIIDTKRRLKPELETPIPLRRFAIANTEDTLLLQDLVRPDFPEWRGIMNSSHSHVDANPPDSLGWGATISVGTLPFVRHFEQFSSPVRVAIISPTMSMFDEAVNNAQRLFTQRGEELAIPDELVNAKPASFDLQIWEEHA